MQKYKWSFREKALSEQNRDPIEAELFNREDAIGALVREAVQNSMDALDRENGREVVRVRFFVPSKEDAVNRQTAELWLEGLTPHLEAADLDVPWVDDRMSFVAVEDFGTRGLQGSTTAAKKSELGPGRHDFYYFWRNVGITGKGEGERGSWGIGKAVYPAASQINTMCGLTVRSDDDKGPLLMGQSSVGVHEIMDGNEKSVQHDAYGFYGNMGERKEDKCFATPICDEEVASNFTRDFMLSRKGEPGLSLVIPFPWFDVSENKTYSEFILAAIKHYAYPILSGQLEIDISNSTASTLLKDEDSLISALGNIDWPGSDQEKEKTEQIILLSMWALEKSESSRITLQRDANLRADWKHTHFVPEDLNKCRESFQKREPVAIRVPVLVRLKDKGVDNVESYFDVYLDQADKLKGSVCHYIRDGLNISDIRGLSMSGVVGLVVIEDEAIANLLRAAENPAHTRWQQQRRLTDKYTGGQDRFRFVAGAPNAILKRLFATENQADTDLLAEFFPDIDPEAKIPKETGGKKKKGEVKEDVGDIPPANLSPLKLSRVSGGFRYERNAVVELRKRRFRMRVGYDCAIGNPFTNWERHDFELDKKPVKVAIVGGDFNCFGNRLIARVDSDDFTLTVTGLSESRDVAISSLEWIDNEEELA